MDGREVNVTLRSPCGPKDTENQYTIDVLAYTQYTLISHVTFDSLTI